MAKRNSLQVKADHFINEIDDFFQDFRNTFLIDSTGRFALFSLLLSLYAVYRSIRNCFF